MRVNQRLVKARAAIAETMTDRLFDECAQFNSKNTKKETIDEFINRGGKIDHIGVIKQPPTKIKEIAMTINAGGKKMKAKEAAEQVKKCPHIPAEEIAVMIPEYSNPLPRRGWIATFLKELGDEKLIERFRDLK